MSPRPSSSSSFTAPTPTPTPTPTATQPDPTPSSDHRLLAVLIVLSIFGAFLISYIVLMTLRLKQRQKEENHLGLGPTHGTTLTHQDHPAVKITPFGTHVVGGRTIPSYQHNPGQDMRIALRRPDGAWDFTDSMPFSPAGIKDLDAVPSLSRSASYNTLNNPSRYNFPEPKKSNDSSESSTSGSELTLAGTQEGTFVFPPPPPPKACLRSRRDPF